MCKRTIANGGEEDQLYNSSWTLNFLCSLNVKALHWNQKGWREASVHESKSILSLLIAHLQITRILNLAVKQKLYIAANSVNNSALRYSIFRHFYELWEWPSLVFSFYSPSWASQVKKHIWNVTLGFCQQFFMCDVCWKGDKRMKRLWLFNKPNH